MLGSHNPARICSHDRLLSVRGLRLGLREPSGEAVARSARLRLRRRWRALPGLQSRPGPRTAAAAVHAGRRVQASISSRRTHAPKNKKITKIVSNKRMLTLTSANQKKRSFFTHCISHFFGPRFRARQSEKVQSPGMAGEQRCLARNRADGLEIPRLPFTPGEESKHH